MANYICLTLPAKWFDSPDPYDPESGNESGEKEYGYNSYDFKTSMLKIIYVLIAGPLNSLLVVSIVACCISWSNKSILNRILSCKLFTILGRLSYCLCLVHFMPIYLRHYDIVSVKEWSISSFVSSLNSFYPLFCKNIHLFSLVFQLMNPFLFL